MQCEEKVERASTYGGKPANPKIGPSYTNCKHEAKWEIVTYTEGGGIKVRNVCTLHKNMLCKGHLKILECTKLLNTHEIRI